MNLMKYKKKAAKAVGGDYCLYAIIIIAAVVIANGVGGIQMNIFNTNTEGTTETHYIYETVTEYYTVTPTAPDGVWYYFSVAFTWTDLVVSGDERDIWVGISSTDVVGLGDHTFDALEENVFYTFMGVRFEEGYDMKFNMMGMQPFPPSYETLTDYITIEARALSGQIPFYRSDYHTDPAGYIMWTWIRA